MKIIISLFVFSFLTGNTFAQHSNGCLVDDKMTSDRVDFEKSMKEKKAHSASSQATVLTVPIVIHVIYHGAIENISDAQIMAQLDTVAKDYRRLNADTINTPTAFKPFAADAQIEFCLAKRDPFGNPSTGINRKFTDSLQFVAGPGTGDHMKYNSSGGMDAWDTHKYLNIWICNLTGASGFSGNPMGHGNAWDGIVMNYTILDGRHLLSHEIGHYLNLMHVYGNENPNCEPTDGGDQVSDTPDQAWSTFGCPAFPQTDSCTTTAPGIMFMNFMDQTNSTCQNLFTLGQVTRMRDALTVARASLLTSNGCVPTVASVGDPETEKEITVYPNPSEGKFSIFNAQYPIINVDVYNVLGELVYSSINTPHLPAGRQDSTFNQIDISSHLPGIYIIHITTSKEFITRKVVKE